MASSKVGGGYGEDVAEHFSAGPTNFDHWSVPGSAESSATAKVVFGANVSVMNHANSHQYLVIALLRISKPVRKSKIEPHT